LDKNQNRQVCKKLPILRAFHHMRKLILIRHASAEPERYPLKDFDRQLDEEGKQTAVALGKYYNDLGLIPEMLLHSAAKRTTETARILATAWTLDEGQLQSELPLYNAGHSVLLERLKHVPADIQILAVVGHNPGISQVATLLSRQNLYQFHPGAGLCLEFSDQDWSGLRPGYGIEKAYFPAQL
jgi:phosphohistidine phosphatase